MTNRYAAVKDSRSDKRRITTVVTGEMANVVVRTVAVFANREPEELPPLNEAIDPDALDALFHPTPRGTSRAGGRVEFSYAGHRVVVTDHRRVAVESIPEPA